MASFYVIETKQPEDNEWTEELGDDTVNLFKTPDDAWLCVGELRKLDGGDGEFSDWANAEYRVAIYAGPEDDERIVGYYE